MKQKKRALCISFPVPAYCITQSITTHPRIGPGCGGLVAEHANHQRWIRGHKARGQGHKKIRGQGQGQPFRGQTLSRPRTGTLEAKDQGHKRKCSPKKKKKKRSSQKFFRRSLKKKKVFTKIFQAISTKKRFPKNFSSAPQNFNNSKNSAVLKPRRLQNVPSRTPPLLTTTLCSLQQYCHKMSYLNQMYEKKAMARA